MNKGLIGSKIKDRLQQTPKPSLALVIEVLILGSLLWAVSYTPSQDSYRRDGSSEKTAAFGWNLVGPDIPVTASPKTQRPVYPYSVVPGGVASAKELQAAVRQDKVVAAHYSDFRTRSVQVIRLKKDRLAYVSYRVANRVYWTRKKVTLHAGETLLTDGTHLARTRCGNRVSELPAEPASPAEPAEKEMNNPVRPARPELTTESVFPPPFWPGGLEPPPLALGGLPEPGMPGGGIPPLPPIPPGSCCSSPSEPKPPHTPLPQPYPPSGPPPISTPEPGSLALLISGLAVLFTLWKFRRPLILSGRN
jgi:hypothetical protein